MNNSVDRASTSGTGKPGFIEWPFSSTLERLTRIKTGKLDANAACDDGRYPFFTCASSPLRIDEAAYDCECVLVAGNGDLNVKYYSGQFNAYQRTYIIESLNSDVLAVPYLYRFLDFYVATLREQSIGGVIKYIKLGNLKDAVIPLPPIPEQNKIVAQLDCIDEGLARANTELLKLDDLVKSRFIEMFERPSYEQKYVKLESVLRKPASNGFFARRADYSDAGNVYILGVANAVNRMYSKVDNLPKTNASLKDIEKHSLSYGDMLFCRSSLVPEGIGKASIVPIGVRPQTLSECHIIRVPLNLDVCIPEFMQVQTSMEHFRKQVISKAKTATMTTIDQKSLLQCDVFLPPIEEQRTYLAFVQQVDKLRFDVQQQIDKLELLKSSLMQEYFG